MNHRVWANRVQVGDVAVVVSGAIDIQRPFLQLAVLADLEGQQLLLAARPV
jgi:hypothetical protein